VQDALRQLQETLTPNVFEPALANTTFVMAMADATAAELIPGLIKVMDQQAPGISVRVVPLTTRDPRRLLEQDQAGLAIGYFPAVLASLTAQAQGGETPAFHHQRLYNSQYVCVMRRGHPLADAPLTLDAFCAARHLLVSFSGRPYGFIDEALAGLGRQRQVVLTVNQFFTAGRVVATSDLLTVLPRHFLSVTGMAEMLVVHELPFKMPPIHVDMLWHRRLEHQSAHRWLRQVMQQLPAQRHATMPTQDAGTP
jgi:DNA-binding transcriptional LysR family regulator